VPATRLARTQKTEEGTQHPDRDTQFRYINDTARARLDQGLPVVSVDTTNKELVGNYVNGGVEWQPAGEPAQGLVHDFPDPKVGKAIPYGVYVLGAGTGWVSVGCDRDTAAFAVATLRRWWEQAGRAAYPDADRLLVTADAGGSNGYRLRAWKTELARFTADTGLEVTVCQFPLGTSKRVMPPPRRRRRTCIATEGLWPSQHTQPSRLCRPLPRFAGLDDHPGGHVVLAVGGDGLPHDLDDLGGEQRIQGGLVDPERLVTSDPDVGESCPLQFAGEDTLRHRPRHSPGPGALIVGHLRRQLTLHGQISHAHPPAGA